MRRRLFNITAVISLLLGVAVVGLWVRGRFAADYLTLRLPYSEWTAMHGEGLLRIARMELDFSTPQYMLDDGLTVRPPSPRWEWTRESVLPDELADVIVRNDPKPWPARWSPLRIDRGMPSRWFSDSPPFAEGWQATVSDWVLALLAVLLPAWWIIRRRGRRVREGYCRVCGYDLRASKERCPECGTEIGNVVH